MARCLRECLSLSVAHVARREALMTPPHFGGKLLGLKGGVRTRISKNTRLSLSPGTNDLVSMIFGTSLTKAFIIID